MKKTISIRALCLAMGLAAGGAWAVTGESVHAGDRYGYDFRTTMQADTPLIVAGRDLTGVSAAPGRGTGVADEGEASKYSGPPSKSIRLLAGWDQTGPSAPPRRVGDFSAEANA